MKFFGNSLLVNIFGFKATLIHGDPCVLDRWLWLKKKIPSTLNNETLLDVGCGSGSFTIGAAKNGYKSIGISWDHRNQKVAENRAIICNLSNKCTFEVFDVRKLNEKEEWKEYFDVCVNFENIEHVVNDRKLMIDISNCLKPGGKLLLTAPYFYLIPITNSDKGPFFPIENGDHVRRGYTKTSLIELCNEAGLNIEEISFCSGFLSQKICYLQKKISIISPILGWLAILPIRFFIHV